MLLINKAKCFLHQSNIIFLNLNVINKCFITFKYKHAESCLISLTVTFICLSSVTSCHFTICDDVDSSRKNAQWIPVTRKPLESWKVHVPFPIWHDVTLYLISMYMFKVLPYWVFHLILTQIVKNGQSWHFCSHFIDEETWVLQRLNDLNSTVVFVFKIEKHIT